LYKPAKEYETFGDGDIAIIPLFGGGYGSLMGILGGGFYLHNISLPIYQKSKNKDRTTKDMFIGFFVVFLSYVVCGVLGLYGFTNRKVDLFRD